MTGAGGAVVGPFAAAPEDRTGDLEAVDASRRHRADTVDRDRYVRKLLFLEHLVDSVQKDLSRLLLLLRHGLGPDLLLESGSDLLEFAYSSEEAVYEVVEWRKLLSVRKIDVLKVDFATHTEPVGVVHQKVERGHPPEPDPDLPIVQQIGHIASALLPGTGRDHFVEVLTHRHWIHLDTELREPGWL
ncbi:MAG: hypothetical protein ACRD2W_04375 [Acidimicrobiales bacterium]